MATDIALAIGVLALVAPGIPPALRVFLLTLAIVDDIGAIVVIAVFYSDDSGRVARGRSDDAGSRVVLRQLGLITLLFVAPAAAVLGRAHGPGSTRDAGRGVAPVKSARDAMRRNQEFPTQDVGSKKRFRRTSTNPKKIPTNGK